MKKTGALFSLMCALIVAGTAAQASLEWSDPESSLLLRGANYLQPFSGVPSWDTLGVLSTRTLVTGDLAELELHPEARVYSGAAKLGFQQLFLRRKFWGLSAAAGLIRENWSVTDGRSSLDLWSRSDLRDPLRAERLPYAMVKVSHVPEAAWAPLLDVAYVPYYEPSLLPVELRPDETNVRTLNPRDSRWLTALPTQVGNATAIQVPLTYEVTGYSAPSAPQYGARARWIDVRGFDFTLVHGQTISSEPTFDVTARGSVTDPALPIIAKLTPVPVLMRTYGAGVETTWRDYSLRAEVASIFQSALKGKDSASRIGGDLVPRIRNTVALGASRESGWKLFNFDLICGGTFFQTFRDETSSLVRDPWEKALAVSVDGRTPHGMGAGVKVLRGIDTGGTLVQPSLSKSLENGLALIISADFLEGPVTDFWGQYTDNDRYVFEMRYLF